MLGYRAPPAKTRLGARHDVVAEATPVCLRPFGSPSGWVTARLDAGPPAWFRAVDTIQGEGGRNRSGLTLFGSESSKSPTASESK